MKNTLLQYHQLPPFKTIRLKEIEPALHEILSENRTKLQELLHTKRSFNWKNLMDPLEEMEDRLYRMWSPVDHLHSVMDSEELREIYNRCLPKLSQYNTELLQNVELYQAIRSIARSKSFKRLNRAQRKIIQDDLLNFKLMGVALKSRHKKRFLELVAHHTQLESKFSENVLDSTQGWTFLVKDKKQLSGLPEYTLEATKCAAKEKKLKGYLLTLDSPVYRSVMMYSNDAGLREIMYEAYVTRASDQGPDAGVYDNTLIIEELLNIRSILAQMLGFKNYAEYALVTKMAKNTKEVMTFLSNIIKKVKPVARQEFRTLQVFAEKEYGIKKLQAWDIAYYTEKLKQKLFDISQEQLRPFFPENKVLSGMFSLVELLYGIKIKERKKVETWHPDVRFFEIYDRKGKIRGSFYTDLYAREHKLGGAWVNDYCMRRKLSKKRIQKPVSYLVYNFNVPTAENPSLLTQDEVTTLFHEFGHCLHHLLTKVNYIDVSGSNGVEQDAVEFPSQFMENFCWQKPVIALISGHYKTGKPLPDDMLENLLKSKNFQAGLQVMRQLEFCLFDLRLHLDFDPKKKGQVQKIINEVRKKISVMPVPKFNRFQNSFCHIFSWNYEVGYYNYKWAEILSSDAFSRFEEEGIFNKKTGQSFLHHILEQGGSQKAMKLFINFRGRKPKIDAMLRHSGLKKCRI